MRLLIPSTGTHLKLTKAWKFKLFNEYRNNPLLKKLGLPEGTYRADKSRSVTLPKDTVLTVDRIYLRKGAEGFDSVTFRVHTYPGKPKKWGKPRFWAKLTDVNQIQCVLDPMTTPGMKGESILGDDHTYRWGCQDEYKVLDRVWVRGMTKAGIGLIVGKTKGAAYLIAMPSDMGKVEPVEARITGTFTVYGTYSIPNDLKPATDAEIAKDTERIAKLSKRRRTEAKGALSRLADLYANPLEGDDLEIVKKRYDNEMGRIPHAHRGRQSHLSHYHRFDYDVDLSWHRFERLGGGERVAIAAACNPPPKKGYWRQGARVTTTEHKVVAAVQMGYLDPGEALAVLPSRVVNHVGDKAMNPLWSDGAPA
jgi:hypothetical protein